jgi:hypothetical protein
VKSVGRSKPPGKKWTEGFKVRVIWVAVAAGRVCLHAKPRFEARALQCITGIRCNAPCPYISWSETAELENDLNEDGVGRRSIDKKQG